VTSLRSEQEPGSKRDKHGHFAEGAASFSGKAKVVSDYLLFLLLTGMRREEAARLVWDDVDLRARTVTIRDTKNGEDHTLPLSDFLVELLARRKTEATNGYVFPGEGKTGHIVEPRRQMEKVTKASSVAFTLHDLRRTFITIAESLDISAYALKRLLNHKMRNDVTAGYIITDVERLRKPMQQITDFILKCVEVKPSAQVVSIDEQTVAQVA
jgi:integrase